MEFGLALAGPRPGTLSGRRCDVDCIGRSWRVDRAAVVGAATTRGADVSSAEPARGAGMRIRTRDRSHE